MIVSKTWCIIVGAAILIAPHSGVLAETRALPGQSPKMKMSGVTSQIGEQKKNSFRTIKVPGLAFTVGYPERLLEKGGVMNGWGARYFAKSGTTNWFHVPVPVASEGEGSKVMLGNIHLLFFASNSSVEEVHLWDGANKIGAFTKLGLTGDYTSKAGAANTFVLPAGIEIKNALSISVGVNFGVQDGQQAAGVTFISAGVAYSLAN